MLTSGQHAEAFTQLRDSTAANDDDDDDDDGLSSLQLYPCPALSVTQPHHVINQ